MAILQAVLALAYEERDVLFREKLMVERALLQVKAELVDRPAEPTEATPEEIGAGALKHDDDEAAERAWWRRLFGSDDDAASDSSATDRSSSHD